MPTLRIGNDRKATALPSSRSRAPVVSNGTLTATRSAVAGTNQRGLAAQPADQLWGLSQHCWRTLALRRASDGTQAGAPENQAWQQSTQKSRPVRSHILPGAIPAGSATRDSNTHVTT